MEGRKKEKMKQEIESSKNEKGKYKKGKTITSRDGYKNMY